MDNELDTGIISIKKKKMDGMLYIVFEIKENYSRELNNINFEKVLKDLAFFYKNLYKNNIKFAQIYKLDMLSSNNVYQEMQYLKRYVNFLENFNYMFEKCNIGTGIIINSEIIKNITNGLLYFYTNVKPVKIFCNEKEARIWIKELLS